MIQSQRVASSLIFFSIIVLCLLVFGSLFGWRGGHWWSADLRSVTKDIPWGSLTHHQQKEASFNVLFGLFGYSETYKGKSNTASYVTLVQDLGSAGPASKFQSLVIVGWMIFSCQAAGLVLSVLGMIFFIRDSQMIQRYLRRQQGKKYVVPRGSYTALVYSICACVMYSLSLFVWLLVGQPIARDICVSLAQSHGFLKEIDDQTGTVLSPFLPVKDLDWHFGYNFFFSIATVVVSVSSVASLFYLRQARYGDAKKPGEEQPLLPMHATSNAQHDEPVLLYRSTE